eukprot:CAMPEP_0170473748 /NCGR_PEP_ID=MMETSP0123-20130129/15610_1 /TAXON_ID=182087 /ORGANISM="Favella ehrenbergii, Strain Fehren 1" /LENGTH=102 /DNA_ID=CAMNT_0010742991 /DNA_START=933 /DNA_END=1241 /DNA_ORIENTATION=+
MSAGNCDQDNRLFNRTRPKSQGKVSSSGKDNKKSRKGKLKDRSTQKLQIVPNLDQAAMGAHLSQDQRDNPLDSIELKSNQRSSDKAASGMDVTRANEIITGS